MRDPNRATFIAREVKKEDVGRGRVGRSGDRMNVANLEQRLDVGFVRVSSQWIAEEDDGVHLSLDDAHADLDVAAFRAGGHALDLHVELARKKLSGRFGCDETESLEQPSVRSAQAEQFVLLRVVRDQRDERSLGGLRSDPQLSNRSHTTRVARLTVEDEATVRREHEQRANGVFTLDALSR